MANFFKNNSPSFNLELLLRWPLVQLQISICYTKFYKILLLGSTVHG